jgi:hypothetical protein
MGDERPKLPEDASSYKTACGQAKSRRHSVLRFKKSSLGKVGD